jgi:hypothetical protein
MLLALLLSLSAHAAPGSFICSAPESAQDQASAIKPIQDFLNKSCDATKPYSLTGGRSDWDRGEVYTYAVCCISK